MNTNRDKDEVFSNENGIPIFKEVPLPNERHPNNFLSYMGSVLSRYRRSLPRETRSASTFGEKILGPYFGKAVNRNRIGSAEKGDPSVAFGVYAAYLHQMGVLPDVIKAIEHGDKNNLRYLMLVEDELSQDIQQAMSQADTNLKARSQREKNR